MTDSAAASAVRCIVIADVSGSRPLFEKLGEAEGQRAVERCMNRIQRVILATGEVLDVHGDEVVAAFPNASEGLFSAAEMQHRVADLPPVSGVKLAIRIGAHMGVMGSDGAADEGDTAAVARNLCDLAASGQILTTERSVLSISRADRPSAKPIASHVYEADVPLPVVEVLWGIHDDGTKIDGMTAPYIPSPRRLRIRYKDEDFHMGPKSTRLSFGRDPTCDVPIPDTRASRHHARLEFRANGFFLIDDSTNGTCVQLDGVDPCVVHHGEMILFGKGKITFGHSLTEGVQDQVEFEILP